MKIKLIIAVVTFRSDNILSHVLAFDQRFWTREKILQDLRRDHRRTMAEAEAEDIKSGVTAGQVYYQSDYLDVVNISFYEVEEVIQ